MAYGEASVYLRFLPPEKAGGFAKAFSPSAREYKDGHVRMVLPEVKRVGEPLLAHLLHVFEPEGD